MGFRNFVIIDGKDVELKDLSKEEQQRLAEFWNRKAAESVNYKEIKPA